MSDWWLHKGWENDFSYEKKKNNVAVIKHNFKWSEQWAGVFFLIWFQVMNGTTHSLKVY